MRSWILVIFCWFLVFLTDGCVSPEREMSIIERRVAPIGAVSYTRSAPVRQAQGMGRSSISYDRTMEYARFMAIGLNGWASPITGTSMLPVMGNGSIAIVEAAAWESVQKDDWIQFYVGQERWIHAVVWIEGDRVQTKGLNNKRQDSFVVHRKAYLGKVAGVFYSKGEHVSNN